MNRPPTARPFVGLAVALLPIAFVTAIAWPILNGELRQDELLLLYRLVNYGVGELLLTPHGGHSLLVSNMAYVVLYRLFGIDAQYWFALMLFTHLINVLLLYRVILTLSGRRWVACGFALAWGGAAVQFGTLSWFAVYGQVLVGTCVVWILLDLAHLDASGSSPSGSTLARWSLLLMAAATSFGVGLAVALAAPIALPLLLSTHTDRRRVAVLLTVVATAIVALYVGHQFLYSQLSARPVSFGLRETFAQTHPGILRVTQIAVALYDLVCSSAANLVPGPILLTDLSGKFIGPLALLPFPETLRRLHAIGALVLITVAALTAFLPARRRALTGLGTLLIASYGIVAIWWVASGRVDVVTLLALKARVDTVPRYHYFGTMILTLIVAVVLDQALHRWRLTKPVAISLGVWLAVALPGHVAAYRTLAAATQDPPWHRIVLDRIRAEIDTHANESVVHIRNRPFRVWGRYHSSIELPGWAGIYAIAHPESRSEGPQVRFIESNPDLLRTVRGEPDTRMAELLVAPEEVSRRERSPTSAVSLPPSVASSRLGAGGTERIEAAHK